MATYNDLRCAACGRTYTGHSTKSTFCGRNCKQRAFRARRTAEQRLRRFDAAAAGLEPAALRHLITEAQRLMGAPVQD